MRILIVGNGGREHALTWAVARSPLCEALFATRPNPGQAALCTALDLSPTDVEGVVAAVEREGIDLTVVGPEAPLAAGLADALRARGRLVVGPGREGARLESSKVFSKQFMLRHGVPTAAATLCQSAVEAEAHLGARASFPVVLKADGLAAGKGVAVCHDRDQALAWVQEVMQGGRFGAAGQRVVIEDFLRGQEVSVMILTDGTRFVAFPPSQDHKARDDGDRGPNTGGMGAYSPVPLVDEALWRRIEADTIQPTLAGLRAEGLDFRGFIYLGLMIVEGQPFVLEYNVRLGDPEAQPLLLRLASDLVPALEACARGRLDVPPPQWDPRAAVCVVMASGGYPDQYPTGLPITGLERPFADGVVFQAGTARRGDQVVTAGGRVLGVTALAPDLPQAIRRAYEQVGRLSFEGEHYRRDIGHRAVTRP
jgi:phosphoribosylamine--glycine ligase